VEQCQLKELGGDQAALISEPDPLTYGLGLVFTTFMDRLKAWFHTGIAEDNERIRWIQNDKLPPRLELMDYFHAFETELNRNEMIGHVMATLHMLHITDIISPQYQQSMFKRRRPQGEATMRDVAPKMEHLPVKFVQLLTSLREKTNRSMPSMSLPETLTAEELRDRPTDAGVPDDDEEEGDPWDALDVNEYEGPSVGKAKASHAAPPDPSAKAPPTEQDSPTAASTGEPTKENELRGTVCPKHTKGHVAKYRIMLDENINSEVAEHCVVDGHSFELTTKTCWEMDGAENLRYPDRMDRHKTKVNAVIRGQPGQDATAFTDQMWLDLDDFFRMFNKMLPKRVNPMSVEELIALLYHDSKCRFEFQCIAGHQKATRKGLAYWPFRIRAVQGHTKRAMDTAAASDAFNAVKIYASSGAAAFQRMNAKGKKITTAEKCPGVIYHRTTKGNWKGILRDGFVAGGGERNSSGRAHSYFSEVQVSDNLDMPIWRKGVLKTPKVFLMHKKRPRVFLSPNIRPLVFLCCEKRQKRKLAGAWPSSNEPTIAFYFGDFVSVHG
jgi:RNA:NAD 2'-phosphotransferase (TPT1/KptA family)